MDYSDHEGVSAGLFASALKVMERSNPAPAGQERLCGHQIEVIVYHLAKAEAAYKKLPLQPKPKGRK